MGIKIDKYTFSGPYTSTSRLKDKAGIYAVHCYYKNEYKLIDIGESARVRTRVENHDRINCWQRHCQGEFAVSVYYTPHWTQMGRMEFQQKIRKKYKPPCGKKSDGRLNFLVD